MNMCPLVVPENPKHIQAMKEGKAPMEYLPYSVLADDARCHKGGADKYGVNNWLLDKIRATTYIGAMLRHLFAWACGQDLDPESGLSHLTHLRACCAIVLDAQKHGTLIDDRDRVESKNETEGEQNDNQINVRSGNTGSSKRDSGPLESESTDSGTGSRHFTTRC